MMDRILPLLNKFVPIGIAVKGLERISPKIKSFLGGATAAGYSANEAIDFLRDQFSGPQMKQPGAGARPDEQAAFNRRHHEETPQRVAQGIAATGAAGLGGLGAAALTGAGQIAAQPSVQSPASPQQANAPAAQATPQPVQGATSAFMQFIQQHPELGNFITKEIQNGLSPIDAALTAKGQKKFRAMIDGIESSIGEPLENIIAQLFNMGQKPPATGQNTTQNSQQSGQNATPAMTQFMAALQEFKKLRSGK